LLRPFFARFADQYADTARRLVAKESTSSSSAGSRHQKSGKRYHKSYCWIRPIAARLQELTEHMDTALVASATAETLRGTTNAASARGAIAAFARPKFWA
jgi:hypothetical protein